MYYKSKDFRNGLKIEINENPYVILENVFFKPGKGQAFHKLKLKNLLNGAMIFKTVKIGVKVKSADIYELSCAYLYNDKEIYFFIDPDSSEIYEVYEDIVINSKYWFKEGINYNILLWNNNIISVKPPKFMNLRVLSADNLNKNNFISRNYKNIILETGLSLKVPIFIKINDIIKIDTEKSIYVSRV